MFGLLAPDALYTAARPILPSVTIITWVVCVGSLFNSLGSWQVPVFIAAVFFLILGAISEAMAWAVAGRSKFAPHDPDHSKACIHMLFITMLVNH